VNIGDQFSRASLYGRYSVVPLHAEVICQACALSPGIPRMKLDIGKEFPYRERQHP